LWWVVEGYYKTRARLLTGAMTERTGPQLLQAALAGDGAATRDLVELLAPVVHARVARTLLRSPPGRRQNRDLRQEIEDFVQEVFAALLAKRAQLLRGWDPTRGLSVENYVGLLSERHVISILRSGRRSPWTEEATDGPRLDATAGRTESAHREVASRQVLARLLERMRAELSPMGQEMFQRLVVDEQTVDEVCAAMQMTADAVYAWRSRLAKLARKLHDDMAQEVTAD
jgi:RNA polymerase sigma-70 factor (ECF subfamily)